VLVLGLAGLVLLLVAGACTACGGWSLSGFEMGSSRCGLVRVVSKAVWSRSDVCCLLQLLQCEVLGLCLFGRAGIEPRDAKARDNPAVKAMKRALSSYSYRTCRSDPDVTDVDQTCKVGKAPRAHSQGNSRGGVTTTH